jgi:hypothetical protein
MIRQKVYKTIFFFLPVLFAAVAAAQTGTVVSATVDRNRILIGEPIQLTLKADIPENEAISFFTIDSIAHFELEKQKIDTTNTSSGTILSQVIRITSFDSGHWVIPSFLLSGNLTTDSIPIDVGYSEFDRNQDYHDIKDIINVEVEKKKETWWWYAAGGGLLLLLLLIYFLTRKKKLVVQPAEPPIDPYKEAMGQIEKLQANKPAPKQYYSAMVDVFRQYVFKKKGIRSLQETTDDLVLQLKDLPVSKDNFNQLAQTLRLSDFVKFAKYNPTAEDDAVLLNGIKQSIQAIEQVN